MSLNLDIKDIRKGDWIIWEYLDKKHVSQVERDTSYYIGQQIGVWSEGGTQIVAVSGREFRKIITKEEHPEEFL